MALQRVTPPAHQLARWSGPNFGKTPLPPERLPVLPSRTCGYFSVNLGTYCAFVGGSCQGNTNAGVNFDYDTLWVSMDVGGTVVSNTPTYDGEMLPMKRLASAVYALQASNSDNLGGIAASGFIQNVLPTSSAQNANFNVLNNGGTTVATAELQQVASATAPVLVLKGGATPGTGADLLQFASSSATLGHISSAGNLYVAASVDTQTSTGLSIGNANASSITIGSASANDLTTIYGSGLVESASSGNTTTALQVDNKSANAVLTVDTLSNSSQGQVLLGKASTNNGELVFYNGTNANTAAVESSATTSSYSLSLPMTETDSDCLKSGTTSGGITPLTFGACYTAGSFINNQSTSTQANANFNIQSANAGYVGGIIQGATSQTGDLFDLEDSSGANLVRFDASGDLDKIGFINTPTGGTGTYGNLLIDSEQFDQTATWVDTNVAAPGANTQVAPDGNTTAESLAGTGSSTVIQTYATSVTGTYTFSVWLKQASGNAVTGLCIFSAGGTPGSCTSTGYTLSSSNWQRFSVTANISSIVSNNVKVEILPGNGSTATVYAWGGQLELSSTPGVYVRTGATNVAASTGTVSNGTAYTIGVNATSGLIQGTGGATVTGTAQINASGSGATTIGNSSGGILSIQGGSGGTTINDTTGGLTLSTTTSGAIAITSAGTLALSSSDFSVNTSGNVTAGTINSDTISATQLLFSGNAASILGPGTATSLAIDSGSATADINIGGGTSQNVNLSGGSGSTGCTVTNSNGNFTCAGALSGSNVSATVVDGLTVANALINNPAASQTIAPTGASTTGLIVQQTSTASPTADIFDVYGTSSATKFIQVTSTAANAGAVSISSVGANAITLTSGSGTVSTNGNISFSQANPQITATTGATTLTVQAPTTGILTLNTGGAGEVDVGVANTTTTKVGNAAGTTTLVQGGTGASAVSIQAAGTGTILVGTVNAATITVGSTSNTNPITLGQSSANNTINIGNANVSANTQIIAIGTGSTSTGKDTVTVGSSNGASATTIQGGTGNINLISSGAVDVQDSAGGNLLSVSTTGNIEDLGYEDSPWGGFGANPVNLVLQSGGVAWTNPRRWPMTNITAPTANTVVAPDGTTTAEQLADTTTNANTIQTVTTSTTGNYTFSVWLKQVSGAATTGLCIFTTGGTPSSCTATAVTPNSTDWQRFSVTQNVTGSLTAVKVEILPGNGASATIDAWGAQLIPGTSAGVYGQTFLTQLIPTEGELVNGNFVDVAPNGAISQFDNFGNLSVAGQISGGNGIFNAYSSTTTALQAIQNGSGFTVPTAIINGGTSPGAGADLLQLQSNGSAVARFNNAGNLYVAGSVDTQTGTGLTIGGANATTIAIGNTSATAQTISVGTNAAANTINIGTGALSSGSDTIAIGTGSTSSGADLVTVGSANGASATTIKSGTGNLALSAAGTGQITLTTNSSSSGVLDKSATNSTTAFQLQNSSGFNVLQGDTSYNSAQGQVILGASSHNNGQLTFDNSAGATQIGLAVTSANTNSYTLDLPSAAPAVNQCLQTSSSSTTQLTFGTCGTANSSLSEVNAWNEHSGTALTFTPSTVGDEIVIFFSSTTASTAVTAMNTTSGSGVTSWSRVTNATGTKGDVDMWTGQVTGTGSTTVTATVSGSPTTYELAAYEFTDSGVSSATSWQMAMYNTNYTTVAATTVTWPGFTPTSSQEAYVGYDSNVGATPSNGSTPGFTYTLTGANNMLVEDPSTTAGTLYQPTTSVASSFPETIGGMLIAFNPTAAVTLQGAYSGSAGASPSIDMTSANKGLTVQNDNSSPITGELFGVHDKTASGLGAGLFTVANTGDTAIYSTDTTGTALAVTGSSITSGTVASFSSGSGNNFTSGNLVNIASQSNAQSGAGALLNVTDSSTTLTTNGASVTGNLLNVSRAMTANVTSSTSPSFDTGTYFGAISGTTSDTVSMTVGTHTNRYILVAVSNDCDGQANLAVTYDSVTIPLIDTDTLNSPNGCVYLYGAPAPVQGTHNLVVAWQPPIINPASWGGAVDSFYNVNPNSPTSTFSTADGTTTTPSVTDSSSVSGQEVVDFMTDSYFPGGCTTFTPTRTQAVNQCESSETMEVGSSYFTATGSSTAMSWSGISAPGTEWNDDAIALNGLQGEFLGNAVASISNSCTITAGSCYDSTNVLSLDQAYSGAAGAVLNITNSGSGDMMDLVSGSTLVAKVSGTGAATFENSANSGSAFAVQNASGTNVLTVSTSGLQVVVGSGSTGETSPVLLVLDSQTGSSTDPTEVDGSMYYNTTDAAFRCGEGGAWVNCINGISQTLSSVSGTTATEALGASNHMLVSPLYIPGQITVGDFYVDVTASLTSGDVGIYNSSGNLVLDGGSGSVTTGTGLKTVAPTQTGSARVLPAGQYYVAVGGTGSGSVAGATLSVAGQIRGVENISGSGTAALPGSITLGSSGTGMADISIGTGSF